MPTLYVTEPGCRIEKEYHRLLVTNPDDEKILAVPLIHITDVVVVGSVGFTTQALCQLLESEIPVSIISKTGKLLGRLQPATAKNIFLRRKQYACAARAESCLKIGRAIAFGKISNQRTQALRLSRAHPQVNTGLLDDLRTDLAEVRSAPDLASLRGLEGRAARRYFEILRQSIPPEWDFTSRSRRPPRSPVNALLSLGYSLLAQNLITALEIVGLDPYEGFFHADAYGRPALALDLMEEFRSVIVDSVVLLVINKKILQPQDFTLDEAGGYSLEPAGLRKFLFQYNHRLQTPYRHPLAQKPVSYQKIFEVQARLLRKVIEDQADAYQPFLLR